MSLAFVLGNGHSRLAVDLQQLRLRGPVYGCNALYRDFTPDVLVSTDKPISSRIQEEGYAMHNRMYTRKPTPGRGAHRVPQAYYGFSSGPIAVGLAALDAHSVIYMIGFDLGPLSNDRFNNVYADSEFYKKSSARPTFTGNWVRQIVQITRDFPRCNFIRVMSETTTDIREFHNLGNMTRLAMPEFLARLNTGKDL
jgi:hypothetical protein